MTDAPKWIVRKRPSGYWRLHKLAGYTNGRPSYRMEHPIYFNRAAAVAEAVRRNADQLKAQP